MDVELTEEEYFAGHGEYHAGISFSSAWSPWRIKGWTDAAQEMLLTVRTFQARANAPAMIPATLRINAPARGEQ